MYIHTHVYMHAHLRTVICAAQHLGWKLQHGGQTRRHTPMFVFMQPIFVFMQCIHVKEMKEGYAKVVTYISP